MKKNLKLSRFLVWVLFAAYALHTPGTTVAMEQEQSRKDQELAMRVAMANKEGVRRALQDGANPNTQDGANPNTKELCGFGTFCGFGTYSGTLLHVHLQAAIVQPGIALSLINAGADLDIKDSSGNTPLHVIADREKPAGITRARYLTMIQIILANRANVNAKNFNGNTPLHKAVWCPSNNLVQTMIDAGADVNARNNSGEVPLHYGGDKKMLARGQAQQLLRARANPNIQSNDGSTPLHRAAELANFVTTLSLLNAGADPMVRNGQGQLPSDVAKILYVKQILLDVINKRIRCAIWSIQQVATDSTGNCLPDELLGHIIGEYRGLSK